MDQGIDFRADPLQQHGGFGEPERLLVRNGNGPRVAFCVSCGIGDGKMITCASCVSASLLFDRGGGSVFEKLDEIRRAFLAGTRG